MVITYELVATKGAYGFGHDWTIVMKKGTQVKKFWLGQDIKVFSRVLGMRMDAAVEHYKKKSGSENFDVVKEYIAADILRKVLDTQRLTQEQLEKVFEKNVWELSIQ